MPSSTGGLQTQLCPGGNRGQRAQVAYKWAVQKGREGLVFGCTQSPGGDIWLLAVGRRLKTSWTSGQPGLGKGESISFISSQVSPHNIATSQPAQGVLKAGWGRAGDLSEPISGVAGKGGLQPSVPFLSPWRLRPALVLTYFSPL